MGDYYYTAVTTFHLQIVSTDSKTLAGIYTTEVHIYYNTTASRGRCLVSRTISMLIITIYIKKFSLLFTTVSAFFKMRRTV